MKWVISFHSRQFFVESCFRWVLNSAQMGSKVGTVKENLDTHKNCARNSISQNEMTFKK